ncbi:hypothetical protein HAX54_045711, partial [Datura stramonium]|nr:hypothetical protein [Datura stramonium]
MAEGMSHRFLGQVVRSGYCIKFREWFRVSPGNNEGRDNLLVEPTTCQLDPPCKDTSIRSARCDISPHQENFAKNVVKLEWVDKQEDVFFGHKDDSARRFLEYFRD